MIEWVDVRDETVEIPFTKVCVYDGANTFWAYLIKIEITGSGRKLFWSVKTPDNYPEPFVTHWVKITPPQKTI